MNKHFKDAEASITSARAATHALLALAEEQRTANLLGYLNAAGTHRMASPIPENILKHVQTEVELRLGLADLDGKEARAFRVIRTAAEAFVALKPGAVLLSETTGHRWTWRTYAALAAEGSGGGYTHVTDFMDNEGPLLVIRDGE